MSLLFAITNWDVDAWMDHFRARSPERVLQSGPFAEQPESVEYVLAWKTPKGIYDGLTNLKVIFSLGAGVDHILSDPDLPDVPIVRVVDPDLTARMIEYVVFHVLFHHRQQLRLSAAQRRGEWARIAQPVASEVRVGIMGLGALGSEAALTLVRLGFDVAGWSRSPKAIEGVATFHGDKGLAPFLARTDILVSLLPLTPETEGLIDTRLLAGLARDGALPGPVLINAGRGKTQREDAILAALDDGTLDAASLDVFSTEPLPPEHPLWAHERVIITPHNAADSDSARLSAYVLDQIEAFERGEPLRNVVDRKAGY